MILPQQNKAQLKLYAYWKAYTLASCIMASNFKIGELWQIVWATEQERSLTLFKHCTDIVGKYKFDVIPMTVIV